MPRRTTTVLAFVLAVALAAPAAASARTKGFEIYNLSGSSIQLKSVDTFGKQPFEEVDGVALKPRVGYVLAPGGPPLHVELKADLLGDNYRADLRFQNSRGVTFSAFLYNWQAVPGPSPLRAGYYSTCHTSYPGADRCTIDRSSQEKITFIDPPGTVNTVPPSQRQAQAEALIELCSEDSKADCEFEALDRKEAWAPTVLVGDPVVNCDAEDETDVKYKAAHTTGVTNSIETSLEYAFTTNFIIQKEKVAVKAKYGREWTDEKTFETSVGMKLKPGHIAYMRLTAPVIRYSGTFTMEVGNTTWRLEGVSFDVPDTRAPEHFNRKSFFDTHTPKLSDAELKGMCDDSDGVTRVDPSRIDVERSGGGGSDLLRAGPESTTLDVVHCQTASSTVVADRGDRVLGRCGEVVRSGPVRRPSG